MFSVVNLIAICLASYYWFKFVEAKLSTDFLKKRSFYFVSLVPLGIALTLILTTPLTKLVFYYNENNEYIHGDFYPTMFVLAISYLLFASGHILYKLRGATTKAQRKEYVILALFLLFPVVAGVIDISVENLPVMELSLLFGTVLVYTHLLQSQIFNDNLTQLNNRNAADKYLAEEIQNADDNKPIIFFMADVDHFKSINDTYGHIEVDRALKTVGKALYKYGLQSHNYVARWGGDEFCIIASGEEGNNPENIMREVQAAIDEERMSGGLKYDLKLSMGYTICKSPLASIEKLVAAADKMLYENKRTISRRS